MGVSQASTKLEGLHKERLERALAFLSAQELDSLIVFSSDSIQSRGNVRYLTNYATPYGTSLAMLHRGGNNILLVPAGSFQIGWASDMAWTADIRAVTNYVSAIVAELQSAGLASRGIGLAGSEDFPGCIEQQLRSALPNVNFKPVSKPFKLMKAIKLDAEIEMARKSVSMADMALGQLSSIMRAGTQENELFAQESHILSAQGAEDYFLLISSGLRTVSPIPSGRFLEKQDAVRVSIEPASPGGFWTQTIRMFCLGKPSTRLESAFGLCSKAISVAEKMLRPGMTGGQVAQAAIEVLREADMGQIGPLGHGMGLDLTEPPFLLASDETVLYPGMVITIHPSLIWNEASIWIGDTYMVTNDFPVRLSSLPNQLTIL
jgi:Xaa-Pro dipeptidase